MSAEGRARIAAAVWTEKRNDRLRTPTSTARVYSVSEPHLAMVIPVQIAAREQPSERAAAPSRSRIVRRSATSCSSGVGQTERSTS
jgi:hypothetical protein